MDIQLNKIDIKLNESKEVFSPGKPSLLLGQMIKINKGYIVCDIGTGTGFFAILASKLGASKVYASDINVKAVGSAKNNVNRNNCRNIFIKKGSLFEPFPIIKFDVIISNPPQEYRKLDSSIIAKALSDSNKNLREMILVKACKRLKTKGILYFLLIQWGDYKRMEKIIDKLYRVKRKIVKKIYKKDYSKSFKQYLVQNQDKYPRVIQKHLDIVFYELIKI